MIIADHLFFETEMISVCLVFLSHDMLEYMIVYSFISFTICVLESVSVIEGKIDARIYLLYDCFKKRKIISRP